jgi:hypothetical protein
MKVTYGHPTHIFFAGMFGPALIPAPLGEIVKVYGEKLPTPPKYEPEQMP